MADVRWNEGQQKAIDSVSKGTVVSAAAGSGKTAVLIERTIRILLNPDLGVGADSLLAVTFTKDAANQMKEKLMAAMRKELARQPQNEWIVKQIELLPLATISTIDAFCFDLVRNNINEFDFSADISIMDKTERTLMLDESFSEACELYLEKYPDKMELLMNNFADENEEKLIETAKILNNFKGSLAFPDSWKKTCYNVFDEVEKNAVSISKYNNIKSACKIYSHIRAFRDILSGDPELDFDTYLELLKDFADKVIEADGDFENSEVQKARADFKACKKKVSKECPLYDIISKFRTNKINKTVNEISSVSIDRFEADEDRKKTEEYFDLLWDFVLVAEKIMYEKMLEKNKVHFSDITHMALGLLGINDDGVVKRTELAEKILAEKRYKVILIDEYQDVNNLQDVILRLISDTKDVSVPGKNMFIVGDIKQSIYSFRESNPEIFDKTRKLAADEKYHDLLESVVLSFNYRSRQNIINFTNFLFEKVMSPLIGGVRYDNNEALVRGAEFKGDDSSVDVLLIENTQTDEDQSDDEKSLDSVVIANKIRTMIQDGFMVSGEDGHRPCRPGDFCILVRTNNNIASYVKAIEEVGYNAVSDTVSGYLGAREVSLAISMLKVIENPMQDIPFAAVCLSPVLDFDANDLANLRMLDKNKKLYQIVLGVARSDDEEYGYKKIDVEDESLVQKCRKAIELIANLRFYASGMSVERLIRKIYDTTDFMSIAAAYEDSHQKRANLRMLIKLAADYESATGGGLSDFIRYLKSVEQSGEDFEGALTITPSANTVLIKTMHKSKGLEYPIVILADLAKEMKSEKKVPKLLCSERYGAAVLLRDEDTHYKYDRQSIYYETQKNINKLQKLSEEMRVLYVAVTRAKEKLILPITFKSKSLKRIITAAGVIQERKDVSFYDVLDFKSFAEIITYALLCYSKRKPLCDYLGILDEDFPDLDKDVDISFESCNNLPKQQTDAAQVVRAKISQPLFARIIDNISAKTSNEGADTLSKLAVTEFVNELNAQKHSGAPTYFPPLADFSKADKVTAADRGTFTHLFMELCDFTKAAQDVEGEINALCAANRLTEIQAQNIDAGTVKAFFATDLYKRCLSGIIYREHKFLVKLSELDLSEEIFGDYKNKAVMVQGIADLIIEEDDGLVIVDYKTDNVDNEMKLIDEYSVQLALYKAAFEKIFHKIVKECYIYSFKLKKAINVFV